MLFPRVLLLRTSSHYVFIRIWKWNTKKALFEKKTKPKNKNQLLKFGNCFRNIKNVDEFLFSSNAFALARARTKAYTIELRRGVRNYALSNWSKSKIENQFFGSWLQKTAVRRSLPRMGKAADIWRSRCVATYVCIHVHTPVLWGFRKFFHPYRALPPRLKWENDQSEDAPTIPVYIRR